MVCPWALPALEKTKGENYFFLSIVRDSPSCLFNSHGMGRTPAKCSQLSPANCFQTDFGTAVLIEHHYYWNTTWINRRFPSFFNKVLICNYFHADDSTNSASFRPCWHIIIIANVNCLCHALNQKRVALHIPEEKYHCMDRVRKKNNESTERLLWVLPVLF